MKAEIESDGTLVLSAESSTEEFALRIWWSDYVNTIKNAGTPLYFEYKLRKAAYPPIME